MTAHEEKMQHLTWGKVPSNHVQAAQEKRLNDTMYHLGAVCFYSQHVWVLQCLECLLAEDQSCYFYHISVLAHHYGGPLVLEHQVSSMYLPSRVYGIWFQGLATVQCYKGHSFTGAMQVKYRISQIGYVELTGTHLEKTERQMY